MLAPGELPSETAGVPVWFNSIDDAYFRLMGVTLGVVAVVLATSIAALVYTSAYYHRDITRS